MTTALRVSETQWRELPAVSIVSEQIQLVVMRKGGHLASISIPGDDMNPLWQPIWKALQPNEEIGDRYGPEPEASLLAGIVGHNLCIDRFGAPWPGETRPLHGEAGVVQWDYQIENNNRVVFTTQLPQAQLTIARTFEISGNTVVVTTSVTQTTIKQESQPIEWCEHVTISDPFLDGAVIETGAREAFTAPFETFDNTESRFASYGPLAPVAIDKVLEMPPSSDKSAFGDCATLVLEKGYFVARNKGYSLKYEWNHDDFPFLCIWSQHYSRTGLPWAGKTRTRGLEFSTKPFPEGKPPVERSQSFAGRSTVCNVPANRQSLNKRFVITWSKDQ
eukprot:TRINITY_DN4716_c0_g1_i1.p1 TRINITY_DN4716_c0_g1~~TRINITY_DN4716_c0_g1_i1.p1  ORF type:complete len:333 (+),score=37.98 TRINITY_DN4716_c0_g1_i1:54-1052(+)